MTYPRTDILAVFEQRFVSGESEHDMLHVDGQWKVSVPHEESGPCYTYDPPNESDPGLMVSIFMRLKTKDWNSDLRIFLHEKNRFFYSIKSAPKTMYLDPKSWKQANTGHPRAIGKNKIVK